MVLNLMLSWGTQANRSYVGGDFALYVNVSVKCELKSLFNGSLSECLAV